MLILFIIVGTCKWDGILYIKLKKKKQKKTLVDCQVSVHTGLFLQNDKEILFESFMLLLM